MDAQIRKFVLFIEKTCKALNWKLSTKHCVKTYAEIRVSKKFNFTTHFDWAHWVRFELQSAKVYSHPRWSSSHSTHVINCMERRPRNIFLDMATCRNEHGSTKWSGSVISLVFSQTGWRSWFAKGRGFSGLVIVSNSFRTNRIKPNQTAEPLVLCKTEKWNVHGKTFLGGLWTCKCFEQYECQFWACLL